MNIVGQDATLKGLDRIFEIFTASECEIKPHFILTGPSGSGKTLTIGSLAKKYDCEFIEINAAALTKEGTSGNSLSKALAPIENAQGKPCVVFADEFDKLFISGNSNSSHAHESTNGVQNEFLKVLESGQASIFGDYGKYNIVSTAKILFVFAGAFNGEEDIDLDRLRAMGIKTEFLGRVGLTFSTSALSLEDLYAILENSDLLDKYLLLFPDTNRDKVIGDIKRHLSEIHAHNTIGARAINTLINQYFIKGGLVDSEVKRTTFQKKLSLTDFDDDLM